MPRQTSVTIPCGEIELEGAFHEPDGPGPHAAVVVCHPHPQYGGDMRNNVVAAIVDGLTERGIAAVRFNFRGVGRSGGDHGSGDDERHDVRAALDWAAAQPGADNERVGLAGYSFGAMMAAAVAEPSLPALALVALPLAMGSPDLTGFDRPLLLLSGDADAFCPTFALRAIGGAMANVDTQIVAGADHFWMGREDEIARRIGDFFARALSPKG